jgi:Ca2+-binding RTX toxin-like protein
VTYAARSATQPLVVAIDATPNSGDTSAANLDGPAGARDTLLIDVENVLGGAGSDMLTGSPFANVLTGNKGADRLIGLDGNDSLKARDSVVDTLIDCDGGPTPGAADVADVDLSDPAPVGCETVTHP